jgi:hypothetical protein
MATKDKYEAYFEESALFITCVKSGNFRQEDLYEIHKEILKIDGRKLEYFDAYKFTADQYFTLCSTALDQNALALEFIEVPFIEADKYRQLCFQAVKQNGFALYYVKRGFFENAPEKLTDLYSAAVIQDNDALQLIRDQTFELCLIAVKHPSALQWVHAELFSKEEYGKICYTAFYEKRALVVIDKLFGTCSEKEYRKNFQALRFVNKNNLFPAQYREICLLAIQCSDESLPFVDTVLWRDEDFCREAMKLSKKSRNFVENLKTTLT